MAELLRRHRLVKATSDLSSDLLAELFRASAGKLDCPQCGRLGLIASASEPVDGEAWGEARKCEACGAAISPERLEVFHDARLCVACQGRDDRGQLSGPQEYCPRCGNIMVTKLSRGSSITRYVLSCPVCRR